MFKVYICEKCLPLTLTRQKNKYTLLGTFKIKTSSSSERSANVKLVGIVSTNNS